MSVFILPSEIDFEALLDPELVGNIERLSSELEYELEALVNLCEAQASEISENSEKTQKFWFKNQFPRKFPRRSFGEVTTESDPTQSELLVDSPKGTEFFKTINQFRKNDIKKLT